MVPAENPPDVAPPIDSIKAFPLYGMAKVVPLTTVPGMKPSSQTNGFDIDSMGELLVVRGTDNFIRLHSLADGSLLKTVSVQKYGGTALRFTHARECILTAGNDSKIRYHSLIDNAFLRTFEGHEKTVTNLDICPLRDIFFSSSLDESIRLWDTRKRNCTAIIERAGQRPVVAADHEGLIFAVGSKKDESTSEMRLFDSRNYSGGPFLTFSFPHDGSLSWGGASWCGMTFSPDGQNILVSTNSFGLFIVDSYDGIIKAQFASRNPDEQCELYGTFSPDGQHVTCGTTRGEIVSWDASNGIEVARWQAHTRPCRFVRYNPVYQQIVSSASHLVFWLPRTLKSIYKPPKMNRIVVDEAVVHNTLSLSGNGRKIANAKVT